MVFIHAVSRGRMPDHLPTGVYSEGVARRTTEGSQVRDGVNRANEVDGISSIKGKSEISTLEGKDIQGLICEGTGKCLVTPPRKADYRRPRCLSCSAHRILNRIMHSYSVTKIIHLRRDWLHRVNRIDCVPKTVPSQGRYWGLRILDRVNRPLHETTQSLSGGKFHPLE